MTSFPIVVERTQPLPPIPYWRKFQFVAWVPEMEEDSPMGFGETGGEAFNELMEWFE